MPPKDRDRNSSRRRRALAVEGLEGRELLTVIIHHFRTAAVHFTNPLAPATVQAEAAGQGGTGGPGTVAPLPSNQNANVLGAPTPAELAKQRFTGAFHGSFMTAQGRYVGEPLQGEVVANGSANQSYRLNAQMQFFLYSDPTAVPTGQIALTPKNTSSTGTILLLDLTSDGTSFSHGLPTHYTWTVNAGSGGLYSGATGTGTLDISYNYSKAPNGVNGRGVALFKVSGSTVTNHGLTLNIATAGNRTQNP